MEHRGYRSEKHLGRLSYYGENLTGTPSVVVGFMCCSLGSFASYHRFGISLVHW